MANVSGTHMERGFSLLVTPCLISVLLPAAVPPGDKHLLDFARNNLFPSTTVHLLLMLIVAQEHYR